MSPDEPETAVVAVRQPARAGLALITGEALAQEAEQRRLLGEYVKSQMVPDVDYGVIPGTKKRTLLKPGAEKLSQLFRCKPAFTLEDKKEEWDTGLFYYRFKCEIVTLGGGEVVAEGVGSCSTYEKKYRERAGGRVCPDCDKPTIKKSKYPDRATPNDPPGWYCFAKIGGCGANFRHDDVKITAQVEQAQQNPDILDCVNTVLKMAKKRALVDAAISLSRSSDLFTQDVEDQARQQQREPVEPQRQPDPDALCDEACAALLDAEDEAQHEHVWNNVYADRKRFSGQQWDKIVAANAKTQTRLATPKPKAAGMNPANGDELHRRLREYDAKLASQRLCGIGALLSYVAAAGSKAGYGEDIARWAGPAIPFAVECVKEFEANLRMPKAAEKPAENLSLTEILTRMHKSTPADAADLCTRLKWLSGALARRLPDFAEQKLFDVIEQAVIMPSSNRMTDLTRDQCGPAWVAVKLFVEQAAKQKAGAA